MPKTSSKEPPVSIKFCDGLQASLKKLYSKLEWIVTPDQGTARPHFLILCQSVKGVGTTQNYIGHSFSLVEFSRIPNKELWLEKTARHLIKALEF